MEMEEALPQDFLKGEYRQTLLSVRLVGLCCKYITSLELSSTLLTGWMPTLLRAGRGMSLWDKASTDPPPELLRLFSYENNSVLLCSFFFISCIHDFFFMISLVMHTFLYCIIAIIL